MRRFRDVLLVLGFATQAWPQADKTPAQIYASSQDSVFLIYLNDSTGSATALGSGFLVSPRTIITNAHVVEAGEPVLAIGPVRIPMKVIQVDKENDLAELSISADLTSKPLVLATRAPAPGEHIFAIGNPEGLEKTISEGIVSGIRNREGNALLQVTSPISHGSSGGPILNASGEVVGVAVGMLENGQNLNFAVPIEYVTKLLARKPEVQGPFHLKESLLSEEELIQAVLNGTYSSEPDSEYQQNLSKSLDGLRAIVHNTSDPAGLRQAACFGTRAVSLSDLGIEAARKLVALQPSADNQALLSYVLYDRAQDEGMNVLFAPKDSDQERTAKAANVKFLAEASTAAERPIRNGAGNALLLANYVLGSAKNDTGDYASAIPFAEHVIHGDANICGQDLVKNAFEMLVTANSQIHHAEEAEKWFQAYAARYEPSPYEWDNEGDRRHEAKDYDSAATAYEKAAQNKAYSYDYCFAASNRFSEEPTKADEVLADGRACIDASTKKTDKNAAQYFTQTLPGIYTNMASVLNDRGVYQQGLDYAKQAIDLDPSYAYAYFIESSIYKDLQQYTECIAAGQNAIRVSDGKYPHMHFVLGNCYFSTQNWPMAANSFKISAEANPSDVASAFNLGLAYLNEERQDDAKRWLREALRRNPDADLRERILKLMPQ